MAIRLKPENAVAYLNRANAYERKSETARALADYKKAIELNPQSTIAYNRLGQLHTRMGNFDRAIANFNQAIKIDPAFTIAYKNRDRAIRLKNNKDDRLTKRISSGQ